MPVIFKEITPKALKQDVFLKQILANAEVAKKGILKDYEAGVKSWNHTVDFEAEIVVSNNGVAITVDTGDEIYFFVHEGTDPHEIRAKPGKKLRFQGTYTAKTVPGVIQSRSGGPSGEFVYRDVVQHPGTKARLFSRPIFRKWKPFFERSMQRALDEAARKSGHAI